MVEPARNQNQRPEARSLRDHQARKRNKEVLNLNQVPSHYDYRKSFPRGQGQRPYGLRDAHQFISLYRQRVNIDFLLQFFHR